MILLLYCRVFRLIECVRCCDAAQLKLGCCHAVVIMARLCYSYMQVYYFAALILTHFRFFSSYHGHSGPRMRNRMRGSDLKILTGLTLREGDQFTEITNIQDSSITVNPRRDCDDAGSWIILEFATAKQNIIDQDDPAADIESDIDSD